MPAAVWLVNMLIYEIVYRKLLQMTSWTLTKMDGLIYDRESSSGGRFGSNQA